MHVGVVPQNDNSCTLLKCGSSVVCLPSLASFLAHERPLDDPHTNDDEGRDSLEPLESCCLHQSFKTGYYSVETKQALSIFSNDDGGQTDPDFESHKYRRRFDFLVGSSSVSRVIFYACATMQGGLS